MKITLFETPKNTLNMKKMYGIMPQKKNASHQRIELANYGKMNTSFKLISNGVILVWVV